MTPEPSSGPARYNNACVAPIWQSRLRRLVALAALVAGLTQHGSARWLLFGAFALILAVDVAWEDRNRRAGRQ